MKTLLAATVSMTLAMSAQAADTIKLGVAGAHSGDLASYGLPTVNAVKLVTDEVNAKGGIDGKQIELLIEDDVCKPEVATNTATKLVSEGADVVIGHICSGATKAALPIYTSADILVVSPSATSPELTQSGDYPNFARTIAADDVQAKTIVDFALDELGVSKIAIIHDKGDYGKGLAEFAQAYLQSKGIEEVLFEGVTPGAVDYSAIVRKIDRSDAEAVIYGGYHPEASKIVKQMRKKRMDTAFLSDDGVKDDTFIKVAGKDAEGVYATGPRDNTTNPVTIAAREAHKAAYGDDPGAFYDNAYAAALAVVAALENAGSTDLDALKKAMQENTVDTPVGTISFAENGDAVGVGFTMYQVKDGAYVQAK
ncbi:branched-chain amino acid ABC transporter substrate-binding protein [Granulosicoccaceae sp. 1_MG-2023]|nr:branched-chain amino acid ABC transporter substrate-binding protein [Granulosicoccaceae sp. 1_MG-2023]